MPHQLVLEGEPVRDRQRWIPFVAKHFQAKYGCNPVAEAVFDDSLLVVPSVLIWTTTAIDI